MKEVQLRKERDELAKIAARKQVVLQKAMLIREKKQQQVEREKQHQARLAAARLRFQENLTHSMAFKERENMKQQKRYEALINDLQDEQRVWITPENMDTVITEELFKKPATTGLKTRVSDHWRYHVQSLQLKRLEKLNEEENYYPEEPMTEDLAYKKYKAANKLQVDDLLLSMVGTGADRARYKELVDKFSETFAELDYEREDLVEYVSKMRIISSS